jgi:hypothetical protein
LLPAMILLISQIEAPCRPIPIYCNIGTIETLFNPGFLGPTDDRRKLLPHLQTLDLGDIL